MWAIRQVVSYLWSAAGYLDAAGTQCDRIPIVGSAVGYPLHRTASALYLAAWSFNDFDQWVDLVATAATQALSTAQAAYSYAAGYLQQQVQAAVSAAQAAYSYAAGYLQQQVQAAVSAAQAAYSYAAGYLQQQVQAAQAAIGQLGTQLQAAIGNIGPAAWSYISSGALQQWIQSWWLGQQQQVLDFLIPKLDVLIAQGFLVVDRSWSSFEGSFAWLLGKLIDLLTREAASFASALWSLLEAILKNIHLPER